MKTITAEQFERIAPLFPRQRGNVRIDNLTFISAILYMAENGCKWRALPAEFGKWNSIYRRFERWAENGVIQRIFAALQAEQIVSISVEILALDSTSCKVHPDAHGALKKEGSSQSAITYTKLLNLLREIGLPPKPGRGTSSPAPLFIPSCKQ
jgi:transposase